VDRGKILCWLENEEGEMQKMEMGPGSAFVVVPGRVHRVEALEDSRLIEASTPQVDDVIRVEDNFNRGDGRIAAEHEEE
jgi:quercetin dioxygenase-like cupin family protein